MIIFNHFFVGEWIHIDRSGQRSWLPDLRRRPWPTARRQQTVLDSGPEKITHSQSKSFDELQQYLYLQMINWICSTVIQNLWRIGSPPDTHPTDRTLGLRRKRRRIFTQNLRFGKLETATDSRFWKGNCKATLNYIRYLCFTFRTSLIKMGALLLFALPVSAWRASGRPLQPQSASTTAWPFSRSASAMAPSSCSEVTSPKTGAPRSSYSSNPTKWLRLRGWHLKW